MEEQDDRSFQAYLVAQGAMVDKFDGFISEVS